MSADGGGPMRKNEPVIRPGARPKRRRAPALPPSERRQIIVQAAIPLLARHGRQVTTAQIAAAAGVAEGTIFRVFPDKLSILDACLEHVLDTTHLEGDLQAASARPTIERRLEATVEALHRHLSHLLPVALALGIVTARTAVDEEHHGVTAANHAVMVTALVARHLRAEAGSFRTSPVTVARLLVGLVFGSAFQEAHSGLPPLGTRMVTRIVLDGVRRDDVAVSGSKP
jgi:AcrR family transcriptional regulator